MAREFTRASSQYLEIAAAVATRPLTMACWFRANNVTDNCELMTCVNSATVAGNNCWRLAIRGNETGDPIISVQGDPFAPSSIAASTAGYTANVWHHAASVIASETSNSVLLDGGNKGTGTSSETPAGLNRFTIGAIRQATAVNFMGGRIAVPCIWNVALSDDEVAQLAAGYHPSLVRPDAIVALWELDQGASPEPDHWGGNALSLGGTPTLAEDPPLIYPPGVLSVVQGVGAAPTTNRRRRFFCGAA